MGGGVLAALASVSGDEKKKTMNGNNKKNLSSVTKNKQTNKREKKREAEQKSVKNALSVNERKYDNALLLVLFLLPVFQGRKL